MKKLGKVMEKVIIGLVFLYAGYNLITGQMELPVEGYLVLLVLVPAALLSMTLPPLSLLRRRGGY